MTNRALLGSWVRRFLLEYVISERNLARNTQRSYRDTLRLLLPFLAHRARTAVDRLAVADLIPERLKLFLNELEEKRACGVATRNPRLAAIHSRAHFIGLQSPEHVESRQLDRLGSRDTGSIAWWTTPLYLKRFVAGLLVLGPVS